MTVWIAHPGVGYAASVWSVSLPGEGIAAHLIATLLNATESRAKAGWAGGQNGQPGFGMSTASGLPAGSM